MSEQENTAETQRVSLTVDGREVQFTPEELSQHIRNSMQVDQREAAITQREARLQAMADRAARMEEWERLIQTDPDAAHQLLAKHTGRPVQPASQEEPDLGDLDADDVAKRELLRLRNEIRDLKTRDRQRDVERAQDKAQRDLDALAGQYPHFTGEMRETFKALVATMAQRSPNTPLAEFGERANNAIAGLVKSQIDRQREERERKESERQTPGATGTPQFTPPAKPFTAKDLKSGGVLAAAKEFLKTNLGSN